MGGNVHDVGCISHGGGSLRQSSGCLGPATPAGDLPATELLRLSIRHVQLARASPRVRECDPDGCASAVWDFLAAHVAYADRLPGHIVRACGGLMGGTH